MSASPGYLLIGEYELTVDAKNRLLVPADFRRVIVPERDGEGLIVVIGVNRKPWLYPETYYQSLVGEMERELAPDEDMLAVEQNFFARAQRVVPDKQGRILLPDKTLRRTNTGRDVTMIGVRDHMELWNREAWDERDAELTEKMGEIILRVKQSQQRQRQQDRDARG